ncbi:MAG: hypothetical protein ACXWC4_07650 [Telluria sp.]
MKDAAQVLDFVRRHGVVLVSARGPVPTLVDAIVGSPVKGSWWGHPEGKRIFALLQELAGHEDVLTCRLVDNKLTLVHRRLWPALAAAAPLLAPAQLARVTQEHTASGRHVNRETPFPDWLPEDVARAARLLAPEAALAALRPDFVTKPGEPNAHD